MRNEQAELGSIQYNYRSLISLEVHNTATGCFKIFDFLFKDKNEVMTKAMFNLNNSSNKNSFFRYQPKLIRSSPTLLIIIMYHPITPKSLIKNSGSLKILFMILLVCTTGVIIQAIMFATNDCGYSYVTYYSCYDNYSYRPYQCSTSYDLKQYCCDGYYSSCGDPSHCGEKYMTYNTNNYYRLCYGHYIAMNCFIGLTLVLSIVIVIKVVMLRKQAKQEEQMRILRLQMANPIMYQQPVIQPQYQVPQTYRQNGVNESTEEWADEPMLR